MPYKILMSACLLGQKVRYDGKDNLQNHLGLNALVQAGEILSICPEMAGGLPTPRPPAEIELGKTAQDVLQGNARILTINGEDVTQAYLNGARKTLALAQENNIQVVILKARSPSCSSHQRYDGTFSRTLINDVGVTTALLLQHHIRVFDETQIDEAISLVIKP